MLQIRRRIHGRDQPDPSTEQRPCPAGAIHTWFEPNGEGSAQTPWLADDLVRPRHDVGGRADRQARAAARLRGSPTTATPQSRYEEDQKTVQWTVFPTIGLTMKVLFGMALRQTTGFVESPARA